MHCGRIVQAESALRFRSIRAERPNAKRKRHHRPLADKARLKPPRWWRAHRRMSLLRSRAENTFPSLGFGTTLVCTFLDCLCIDFEFDVLTDFQDAAFQCLVVIDAVVF